MCRNICGVTSQAAATHFCRHYELRGRGGSNGTYHGRANLMTARFREIDIIAKAEDIPTLKTYGITFHIP